MLKLMRESFKHLKWILILVVGVFVLFVFAEWGASGASGGAGATVGYAARVNGSPIVPMEYNRAMALTEQRYEQSFGRLTPELREQLNLGQQVLNSLIQQELLLQEARRLGLEPTPAELRSRILEIPILNPDGQFVGEELYHRWVTAQLGYPNAGAFERDLARDLTISKLDSAMFNSVAIPPSRVEQEYRRRNESARVRYVLAPAAQFIDQVNVTPAEVEQFYRSNTTRYSHPEQRKVDYLLADLSRIRSQIQPTDAELRQRYEASKQEFTQPDQVCAAHILLSVPAGATPAEAAAIEQKASSIAARLRAGEDFAKLAAEFSADPGSAANGGDLGCFGRGAMVAPFEEAAFSQQPGQIGNPVRSEFGYHIIRVNEKRPGGVAPFEQVSDGLRQQMITERAESQARDRLAQIRARLEQQRPISSDKMAAVADNFVSLNTTPFFQRAGAIEGLGPVVELNNWAFGAEQGDLGPVIQTPQGPIVPFLRESRPSGVAPLDEIRARVENDAKASRAAQRASETLKQASAGGAGPVAAAAKLGLTTSEATLSRDGRIAGLTGDISEIVKTAFDAQPGQVRGPFVTNEGALLLEVVEQQKFDPARFAQEKAGLEENLRRSEAIRLRQALLDRLRRNADVEINEEIVAPGQAGRRPVG